jgi:hypothetical protein
LVKRPKSRPISHDGAIETREFHLRRLQIAIGFVACATLAPERPIPFALHLELHFREAFERVPRHQLVDPLRDRVHPRRAVIERKTDGIEQRRLASAGRTGDREQAVVTKRRLTEVDLPLAL